MGEAREAVVVVGRAKALRPSDSGVHRAVHAANGCPANDQGQSLHAVPERCEDTRREALMVSLKALARVGLAADGVSLGDAAAAVDRQKPHVVDMLDRRGRSMTAADLVLLAVESEAFWEGVKETRRVLREKRGERK